MEPIILEGYLYTEAQEGGYAEDAVFLVDDTKLCGYEHQANSNLAKMVQSHFRLKHDYEPSPKVRIRIEVI